MTGVLVASLLLAGFGLVAFDGDGRTRSIRLVPLEAEATPRSTQSTNGALSRAPVRWALRIVGALLAGALLAGAIAQPILGLVAGVGLAGSGRVLKRSRDQKEALARDTTLPATLDLFAVVIGSGGTSSEAIRVASKQAGPSVRPAFEELERQRAAGQPLVWVLTKAPEVLGESYRSLIRALLATERDGAPIGHLLTQLAEEAGQKRRRHFEARAKRLSVQLIFPLVCCFLPAVLLGAIVPLIAVSSRGLLS